MSTEHRVPTDQRTPTDGHAVKWRTLLDRVVQGPGSTPPALRQHAADDVGLSGPLATYVHQVHVDALRTTDAQVDALRPEFTEDQIFELTVAAAMGAGRRRLDRVQALLAERERT